MHVVAFNFIVIEALMFTVLTFFVDDSMSNASSVTSTVTGGIQEISALLPLLGTDQCEEHTGSALGKGYLYSGVTPISIFGSLGIIKAGFNILAAGIVIPSRQFLGAQQLADGGFRPTGEVARLIAFDPKNPRRFLAESNLEHILEQEHIENVEDLKIEWPDGSLHWNIWMVVFTFAICTLGITPYLYIILRSKVPGESLLFSGWAFPVARLVSSAISCIVIQIILQIRILVITKNRLLFITMDRYMNKEANGLELKSHLREWSASRSSEICLWELQAYLDNLKPKYNIITGALSSVTIGAKSTMATGVEHFTRRIPLLPGSTVQPNDDTEQPEIDVIEAKYPSPVLPIDTGLASNDLNAAHVLLDIGNSTQPDEGSKGSNFQQFRQKFKEMKKNHFPPNRVLGLSLADIIHTWTYFFLHVILFFALFVSVLGYVGSFSLIQNSRQNAGPVLWLALEVLLCILRIAIWAWNPDLDDNKGVAFKIALASKSPLVTCNIYGDDLESIDIDVEAPVVRSKGFLEEIASYTGPLAAFQWKDTALYYILTGSKYSEQPDMHVDKTLYIVISDFKEQTSRIAVKRSPGANFTFFMSMLRPDPQSAVITVNTHPSLFDQRSSDTNITTPDTHVLTCDPDFVHQLSAHYDGIVARINDTEHGNDRTFFSSWALDYLEKPQPNVEKTTERQPKLTSADLAYLNHGRLDTRRTIYARRLERWISDCANLYEKELLEQVPFARSDVLLSKLNGIEINEVEYLIVEIRRQMEKVLLNTFVQWLSLVDGESDEVFDKVIQFFSSPSVEVRSTRLSQKAPSNSKNITTGTKDATIAALKLQTRLKNEKTRNITRMKQVDWDKMQKRIHSEYQSVRLRIQGRKHIDGKERKRIIQKWRKDLKGDPAWIKYAGVGSNIKSMDSLHSVASNISDADDQTEDYKKMMKRRLQRKARFLNGPDGKDLLQRCSDRANQWQNALKIHIDEFTIVGEPEFLKTVSFLPRVFDARRKYWSVQALTQRLRLMDKHLKYLIVTEELVKDVGGFDNLALALRQSSVSTLYFADKYRLSGSSDLVDDQQTPQLLVTPEVKDDLSSDESGSDVDDFSETDGEDNTPPRQLSESVLSTYKSLPKFALRAIATSSRYITGICFAASRLSDDIQAIISSNISTILDTPGLQTVCEFEGIEVTDRLRLNRPYVVFGRSRPSKCTIKFVVQDHKVKHVLALTHTSTSLEGEIDIKLNGQRLANTKKGTQQQSINSFYSETFDIPDRLKMRPEINIITITFRQDQPGEVYYLSDAIIYKTSDAASLKSDIPYCK